LLLRRVGWLPSVCLSELSVCRCGAVCGTQLRGLFKRENIKNSTQSDRHTFVFISLFKFSLSKQQTLACARRRRRRLSLSSLVSLFFDVASHIFSSSFSSSPHRHKEKERERKGFVATSRFRFYRGGYSCLLLCGA